jgi:Alkylmercury lyase
MSGLERGQLRRVLLDLQQGFAVTVAEDRLQLNLVKAPPYSAVPTPVSCFIDGEFHAYLGCAAEAFTIANLPMYSGKSLEIRSYCACCYEPISLEVEGISLMAQQPADICVAVVNSPWSWGPGIPCDRVCDSFHFVLGRTHASNFEEQIGRSGVVATTEQMQAVSRGTAMRRMHAPDWGPIRREPDAFIEVFRETGIDVSAWQVM